MKSACVTENDQITDFAISYPNSVSMATIKYIDRPLFNKHSDIDAYG